jgi:hypothetical protein
MFLHQLSHPNGQLIHTYSQRNWVEVVDREAKGWLGLNEYQVGDKSS